MSLWHYPAGCPDWVLPSTLPYGARTFLRNHAVAWHRDRLAYSQTTSPPGGGGSCAVLITGDELPAQRLYHEAQFARR